MRSLKNCLVLLSNWRVSSSFHFFSLIIFFNPSSLYTVTVWCSIKYQRSAVVTNSTKNRPDHSAWRVCCFSRLLSNHMFSIRVPSVILIELTIAVQFAFAVIPTGGTVRDWTPTVLVIPSKDVKTKHVYHLADDCYFVLLIHRKLKPNKLRSWLPCTRADSLPVFRVFLVATIDGYQFHLYVLNNFMFVIF